MLFSLKSKKIVVDPARPEQADALQALLNEGVTTDVVNDNKGLVMS